MRQPKDDSQAPSSETRAGTRFGRDVLVFGGASVVGQLASAATTPLYSRVLGPTQFGALEIAQASVSLAVTILLLGMDQAVVREVSFGAPAGPTVSHAVRLPLIITVAAATVVVVRPHTLGDWLFASGGQDALLRVTAIGLPFLVVAQLTQEAVRAAGAEGPYLRSALSRSLVPAVVAPTVILATSLRATGVIVGLVAGAGAASIVNLMSLGFRSPGANRGDSGRQRRLLAYGLPLLPATVAGWSIMLIDRVILAHDAPLAAVGVYSMSNRVAGLLLVVVYAFGVVWTAPALRVAEGSPERGGQFRDLGLAVAWPGLSLGAIALGAIAPEMVRIVGGSRYAGAAALVPLLGLGLVELGQIPLLQTQLLSRGRSGVVALIAAGAAIANVALTIPLVARRGAEGAALATAVTFVLWVGIHLAVSVRLAPATSRTWRAAIAGAFGAACLVGEWWLERHGSPALLPRAGFVVAYPVLILVTRVARFGDVSLLMNHRPGPVEAS